VYFELGADDNYTGEPQTWRCVARVPHPSATILFAEDAGSADHIMAQFWITPADATDLASGRHQGRANYAFVDGHGALLALSSVFAPPQVDLFNPSLAQ
jgi:prepilin-type processing-associated H-X9-DG protein